MKNTTDQKLQKLRRDVYGRYGDIAKETGVTISTVSRVLNGYYINMSIIDKAIEVRLRIQNEKKVSLSKLNDLL